MVQLLYYEMQLFFRPPFVLPQPIIIQRDAILVLHEATSRNEQLAERK